MRITRRRIVVSVLAFMAVALATVVAAPFIAMIVYFGKIVRRGKRGRERLFFETDYEELLAACRELSRRVASGELKKAQYCVYLGDRDPETLSFPQVILDLEPALIRVYAEDYGRVEIELCPGPDWFGVVAFPEGHEEWGDIKLIDGLWYSDAGYRAYPDYMKKVDALVEKGRQLRARRETREIRMPQQK
jgi:hypothetical protein